MRESGILMHITSLPGNYGVGTLGKQAFAFVDFLKEAGQSYWQMLPLTPTGYGDSPYQSCSSFAGNPYLIDLDVLVEEGLLQQQELDALDWCSTPEKVDFGKQYQNRPDVLYRAFSRFREWEALDTFCMKNQSWLPDFTLYMALREESGGKPWYQWEEPLKRRRPDAMEKARERLCRRIRYFSFVQYLFYRQWEALRSYANKNGVRIIGDVPIYVPLDSCEVWSDPELFQLDENMDPIAVAGCPPDAFSEDGQLWGNPLYRWELHGITGYRWWLHRLAAAGRLYDVVRMDHFRGFESYWSVPFGDDTARNGKWCKGPGMEFISAVKKGLPGIRMIAEDLGFLTPEVLELRDRSGYPGMKILQFAFDSREPSDYLPHTYTQNTVCYTGTHDNMTTRQWLESASPEAVAYAAEYMNLTQQEGYTWGVIRVAMASVSDLCVIPIQDCLDLGEKARMNFPGTMTDANWTWRAGEGFAGKALAKKLRRLTELYGRCEPGEHFA